MALLAELDRASRVEELTKALVKILRTRYNLLPDLLERLSAEEVTIAQKAAIALGYLGAPEAVMPLARVLQTRPQHLCWQATDALSRIGGSQVVNYLARLLQSSSVQMQSATAKSLSKCGFPGIAPLLGCLRDERTDDLVKLYAIHSLGEIGSPLAVADLIALLNHRSKHIRTESIWALAQIRSPLAIDPLASLLTDHDFGVQTSAAQALKTIGASALPALINLLKSPTSHTRSVAVRTLAQMGCEEAIHSLAEILFNDPFPYVRCDAINALGELGTPAAISYLGDAIKDHDRSVRTAATRALRKLKSPPAVQILRQIDPEWAQQRTQFAVNQEDYTIIQQLVSAQAIRSPMAQGSNPRTPQREKVFLGKSRSS